MNFASNYCSDKENCLYYISSTSPIYWQMSSKSTLSTSLVTTSSTTALALERSCSKMVAIYKEKTELCIIIPVENSYLLLSLIQAQDWVVTGLCCYAQCSQEATILQVTTWFLLDTVHVSIYMLHACSVYANTHALTSHDIAYTLHIACFYTVCIVHVPDKAHKAETSGRALIMKLFTTLRKCVSDSFLEGQCDVVGGHCSGVAFSSWGSIGLSPEKF